MNKEEAINVLNDYDINFERHTAEAVAEAHEMAIEVLKAQPSEDCISRKAAIDALWKALHEYENKTENQFLKSKELDVADWFQHRIFVQNMSDIDRQTILNLPSVTPQSKIGQQKTGHWLSQSEYCKINNLLPSGLGCYFWCSECNCGIDYKYFHLADYNYCPKCGAKMQEVKK